MVAWGWWELEGRQGVRPKGYGVSFRGDESVLKCTTLVASYTYLSVY